MQMDTNRWWLGYQEWNNDLIQSLNIWLAKQPVIVFVLFSTTGHSDKQIVGAKRLALNM